MEDAIAQKLAERIKRVSTEMDHSYEMFALHLGMLDVESGKFLYPNEVDKRNIDLEEAVKNSINALSKARAFQELIGFAKDIYGSSPELDKFEEHIIGVVQNTETANSGFIERYRALKDANVSRESYSFLNRLYSLIQWKRRKS